MLYYFFSFNGVVGGGGYFTKFSGVGFSTRNIFEPNCENKWPQISKINEKEAKLD